MSRADLDVAERLARIRSLLAGLPGALGNGQVLAWVNPGNAESMPEQVFALIDGAHRLLERWGPGGGGDGIPVDAADLKTKLSEVDEGTAAQVLVWALSTTMAYGAGGRYPEEKAQDLVKTLIRLLGYNAHWWTNRGDARSWKPVTRHSMDVVVVGTGGGVIVTVLAVDED